MHHLWWGVKYMAWEIPSSNETYLHCQSPIGKQSHRFLVASQFWTYILTVFFACQFSFEIWSLQSRKNHTSMGWNRNGRAVAQRPGLDEGLVQTIWPGGPWPLWGLHRGPASVSQMSGSLALWPSQHIAHLPLQVFTWWVTTKIFASTATAAVFSTSVLTLPGHAALTALLEGFALTWLMILTFFQNLQKCLFFKDEVQNLFYLFFRDEVSFGGSNAMLKLGKSESPWEPQVN